MIDKLRIAETYNHTRRGGRLLSTPYRMFPNATPVRRRVMADPMIIHTGPRVFGGRGEIRDQYHHCTDVVPTILECCGLRCRRGGRHVQNPFRGVDGCSFDDADAPTCKQTQYHEMLPAPAEARGT